MFLLGGFSSSSSSSSIMKRPREDRSSAEETIDEGRHALHPGSMKASFVRCGSPTATTQVMARKKRRGIIEKRRRDRINNSLSELRRLVPTAFEKQGSAKLEKAEILQMTVDHLKMLQVTGGKGYLDAHALALDFLSLGYRECVTEVSRYLSTVEGLDSRDPLHSRLLSHLTSCASQHDVATLTAASHQHHPFPHPPPPQHWAAAVATLRPLPYGLSGLPVSPDTRGGGGGPQRLMEISQRSVVSSSFASLTDSSSSSLSSSSSSSLMLPCPPTTSLLSLSASFPITFHGGFPLRPPSSLTSTSPPGSSSSSSSSQTPHSISRKPYRPWGTEVGAF
ncbi:hairy/enhancer-of-split related with YRPW motif protein 2 [Melanotaenia boesemani]|uniref:hairy/enhancer-of-split related with YRPW motif protein 2 n=1 Tax=Melanotaenia boesemani TaxID=1250792 RepID=UPI001C03ADE3|nr:hairy/enhancer-of-split related with YRPW motif protein 2 [Melanotaenia boesemani]